MNYLTSQYGKKTLSGQHHEQSQNLSFPVQNYLNKSGGLIPAIRSSDFIEYSPSRIQFGANPNSESEQSIAWAQQTGGIVSMMWHWNAPTDLINQPGQEWWRGFYADATTFDLPGALANPMGSDYQLILRDIDAIADELQKFKDAGIPVIWHPLHEAQGGWFWWGDHGPDTFKELWNLTYDRLTNVHGLHNLIWEYTIASSAAEGFNLDWYPGDDMVDMVGLDIYTDPSSSMSGQWSEALDLFDGNKMLALSETGTLPDPDLMDQWGIEWSYFSPWKGSFVDAMNPADLQATLGHEDVITLDELPALPWNDNGEFLSADFDFNGSVDGDDLTTLLLAFGIIDVADTDGDGDTDGADFLTWQQQMAVSLSLGMTSAVIPEPSTLALLTMAAVAGYCRRML
jgi:mannan endo-1,4-beta-mannosidase